MPKTTKKIATKKVAKKAPVEKTATKSTFTPKPVMVDIPKPDIYCHCTKRKRNTILTCVFTGAFLLGIFIAHLFFCPACSHHKNAGIHITQFQNGCLVISSIAGSEMEQLIPMMDENKDGCITREEYVRVRADFVKKQTQRSGKPKMQHKHRVPHQEQAAPVEEPAVVDAIAPVMED